ncbi:hypothetical protein PtA15_7A438 [Puccinia triticina]|uniref:Mediator of RNA polymerase II transcription subunit 21 n=1 Tax=Puccinia triticina TaxID=208348 RepID=A0ABY7CNV0_9BASI|nr:uncharacterized protein PtA15_7A438 [Puccinia triticina]WAQ86710.1 hypothetical protein PtA15_7A438 [Puccinia triticina]
MAQHTRLALARFLAIHTTRHALLAELHGALQPAHHHGQDSPPAQQSHSGCRHEHKTIDTSPEEYIQQVIAIATSGLIEIRDEAKLLIHILGSDLNRADLAGLLGRIEALQADSIAEYLQQSLLCRKARVEERDYSARLAGRQQKLDALAQAIAGLAEEVQAELADLP